MSRHEVFVAQCAGKQAFDSFRLAEQVAKRTTRKPRHGVMKGAGKTRPYRCPHCQKWHFGLGDGR